MKAKEFKEVNVRFAENQEEYETLPVYCNTEEGSAMFCFELSDEEKARIAETGELYVKVLTFNKPLQPIAMSCIKDELYIPMGEGEEVCDE